MRLLELRLASLVCATESLIPIPQKRAKARGGGNSMVRYLRMIASAREMRTATRVSHIRFFWKGGGGERGGFGERSRLIKTPSLGTLMVQGTNPFTQLLEI